MADVIIPTDQSIEGDPPADALVLFVTGNTVIGTRRWDAVLAIARGQVEGLPAIPEDGFEYVLMGRDNIGEQGEDDPIRFWRRPRWVPTTPGTQSGIGRVLRVFGEGDRDYRWEAFEVDDPLPAIPEDNFDYTLMGRDRPGSGGQADPIRFWARPLVVPSTPGTQSGIGRVLTVFGTNDRDYRWEALNISAGDVATAVEAYLAANPPSGTADEVARREAAAATAAAMSAGAAAAAAQLDADTVIEAGPDFTAGDTAQRNLYISIRHPVNAYSEANIISVSVQGSTPNLQAYSPATLQATYTVGITTVEMGNIADGGHLAAGGFITVQIRLTTGRDGPVQFIRNIEVPVVAAAPRDAVDQVARDAAAAARTVANANAAALIPPSDAEAETATATNVRGWSAAKLRRLVEAIVPAWARAAAAPSPAIAAAVIGGSIGRGTTTLRNNQAIALNNDTPTTVIMRNSQNLPNGASYNNNTGQLTLGVGTWQLSTSVAFAYTARSIANASHAIRIVNDVEGPTAAVVIAAQQAYRVGSGALTGIEALTTGAIVQVADLGGGNDSAVITVQAENDIIGTGGRASVNAGRLDVVKLG